MIIEQKWFAEITASVKEAAKASGDRLALKRADRRVRGALVRGLLRMSQKRGKIDREDPLDFMLIMGRFAHLSQGQLLQDLWALWETNEKKNGYFVEFGAFDGKTLSNTWLLEKHFGWQGIVAEPNPAYSTTLSKNRSCYTTTSCVHWRTGEAVPFHVVKSPELSRLASVNPDDRHESLGRRDKFDEVMVPTISLHDLLIEAGAPSTIDYLSVDTEGSEFEILSALDFSRWNIHLISVEHNKTAKREMIYGLLTQAGYRRKWEFLTQYDDWYVKPEASPSGISD